MQTQEWNHLDLNIFIKEGAVEKEKQLIHC